MTETYFPWQFIKNAWHKHFIPYGEDANHLLKSVVEGEMLFEPENRENIFFTDTNELGMKELYISKTVLSKLEQVLTLKAKESLLPIPAPVPVPLQPRHLQAEDVLDLKALVKLNLTIKKHNKKALRLRNACEDLLLAKDIVLKKQHIFCSIDIEAWEHDHSCLMEIGWSMMDTRNNLFLDQHYLMSEYRHLKNGSYVPDHKLQFQFGTSVWCTLPQALSELKKNLDWAVASAGGVYIVGHGFDSDLKYLSKQDFLWPGKDPQAIDTKDIANSGVLKILNTDLLYGASIQNIETTPSLVKCLNAFNINAWCLHNAGNDAHYTLELLLALADKENKEGEATNNEQGK